MKKLGLIFIFGMIAGPLEASHLQDINASNISLGILPNARLDPSSVTLQGNSISLSALQAQVDTVQGAARARYSSIIVGTVTLYSADIDGTDTETLNQALGLIGARGATSASTITPHVIFMQEGVYTITGATIPKNVHLYAAPGSSTIWAMTNSVANMVTIYGTLDGITFDLGNRSPTSKVVNLSTGAQLLNCKFINSTISNGGTGGGTGSALVAIVRSSGSIVKNLIIENMGNVNDYTNSAPIMIYNSVDTILDNITVSTMQTDGSSNGSFITTLYSTRTWIQNSDFRSVGAYFINVNSGSRDTMIINNKFLCDDVTTGGVIFLQNNVTPANVISTMTYIAGNVFHYATAANNPIINLSNNTMFGVHIKGNVARKESAIAGTATFINIGGGGVNKTVIQDNWVEGMTFISDGGTSTQFASFGNFVNGVEQ